MPMKPNLAIIAELETEDRIAAKRLRHLAPPGEAFKVVRQAKITDAAPLAPHYTDEQRVRLQALYSKVIAVGIASITKSTGK